jgi:hypothetical protein
MGLVDSIIGVESGGNPNATNPNSSASGLGQFIDSTWLSTIKQARPDLAQGKSDSELLALKTDPDLSRQMTEAYANQNQAILSKAGVPVTPGSTYLAHFAGPGGAVKVLQADPNAPVETILGEAAVKANPFLRGMTASGLQAWADRKMGGSSPQPTPAPAPAASAPSAPQSPQPGPPLQIAPQAPPVFPQAPQQAPQQQAAAQPAAFEQIPQMQAPPIFYAPRRSPDISRLRTAFKAPVFPRG